MGSYIDRSRTYLHNGKELKKGTPFEMDESTARQLSERYGSLERLDKPAPPIELAPKKVAPPKAETYQAPGAPEDEIALDCGGGWWLYNGKKYRAAKLPPGVVPKR